MITPPKLKKEDIVYCFSPCAYTDYEQVSAMLAYLHSRGLRTMLGSYTVPSIPPSCYFSATDEERIADFREAIFNPDVKAIWCMRGGYGASRIIDKLPYEALAMSPKWLIGFSDITLFHLHLARLGVCSLHAHMSSFLGRGGDEKDMEETINFLCQPHHHLNLKIDTHQNNRKGYIKGMLIGGNLSLITNAIGTESEPIWEGAILCIEDVGDYLYRIERMLLQLLRRGVFSKIKGLVVGEFVDITDTKRPLGVGLHEMICNITEAYDFPIAYNVPIGHGTRNFPFVQGGTYELNIDDHQTTLELIV